VLTGVYYGKHAPYLPVLYTWDDAKRMFSHMAAWPEEPFTGNGIAAGGGCMLVRRKVFDRLSHLREIVAERGNPSKHALPESVFGKPFDRIPEFTMSEDLSFYFRCMLAGIKCWVHPGVTCGHLRVVPTTSVDFARSAEHHPTSRVQLELAR